MMTLKLIGMLMIVSVGIFSSICTVRYERRRLSVLDSWIDLIFYTRAQIDCYLTPVKEILSGGGNALLDACVKEPHTTDLSAVLERSSVYLDGETGRLLGGFVRELGGGYKEEQLRRCDYYMEDLRRRREKIAAELPMRQKMAVTLCICITLGAVILLW